jgi:NitT/TauT family transport system permease protein
MVQRHFIVVGLRVAFLVGVTAALEILCREGVIPRLTMVPPSEMATSLYAALRSGRYTADIVFTFTNIAAAVAISVVAGAALGFLIHAFPRLRRLMDPLLASYYAVPTFAFYPLLIVLFGITRWPLVSIGAMFGVVAMILNTINGLDGIPPVLVKVGRVLRLDRWETMWQIKLPAAAPSLFTGVKLAVTYSVIGVIAGEFILSVSGLGRQIKLAYDDLDNPTMYGLLLLLLTVTVVLYFIVHGWERRIYSRWSSS